MKDKIIIRVFLTVFVILALTGIVYVKGNEYCEIEGKYETINYNQYIIGIEGYELIDDKYITKGDDPQIIFDISKYKEGKAYGISITFDEEIYPSDLTIYYAHNDYAFSQTDSYTFTGKKRTEYSFVIPEDFSSFRIDVNYDFSISDISIANEFSVKEYNDSYGYIVALIASLLIAVVFSLPTRFGKDIDYTIDYVYRHSVSKIKKLFAICKKSNKKTLGIKIGIFAIIFLFAVILEKSLVILGIVRYYNKYRCIIVIASLMLIYITVLFRKLLLKKIHIYFFVVVMIVGSTNILVSPPVVGLAHDDEIHYERTAYLSYGCNGKVSYADSKLKKRYQQVIGTKDVYNSNIRQEWEVEINEAAKIFENKTLLVDCKTSKFNLQYIPYIPGAIGMVFARAIGMEFTNQLMLVKLINLVCYAGIMALAISLLKKRGQLILFAIGLIPTSVYMASQVTYDWWVISLCVLSYSMFISKKQKNEVISEKYFALIVGIMVLALLPKAIYFPMIIPLMFYGRDCYKNSKICKVLAICGMGLLIMTFVLPMMVSGDGITDLRGGSDVNSIEQMKYILTHPFEYAKILTNFLIDYLSLDAAKGYLTLLGYNGIADYFTICIVVICIAALLDNHKRKDILDTRKHKNYVLYKLFVYASMFITIVLVATSLYVMFTPVSASVILGCQYRYLLPVIFPLVFYVSEINIEVNENTKKKCVAFSSIMMTMIFFIGIYSLCVSVY